jgi:hypothetical protein
MHVENVAQQQELPATSVKSQCRSKLKPSIAEISTEQLSIDEAFLGAVNTTGEQDDWRVTVSLRKEDVEFKLDTGAEVDAISEATYKTLGCPRLCKPSRILYGPAKQPVEVLGVFSDTVRRGKHSMRRPIYVVKRLHTNLLSLKTITALKLVHQVDSSASWTPTVDFGKSPLQNSQGHSQRSLLLGGINLTNYRLEYPVPQNSSRGECTIS